MPIKKLPNREDCGPNQNIVRQKIRIDRLTNGRTFPSDAVMFLRCRLHGGASSSNSLCPQQLHRPPKNLRLPKLPRDEFPVSDVLPDSPLATPTLGRPLLMLWLPFSPNDAAATNAVSYDCCPCLPAAPVIVASLPPIGRHRMLVRPCRLLIGRHNPADSSLVETPPTRLTGNAKMHRKATEQLQAAGD